MVSDPGSCPPLPWGKPGGGEEAEVLRRGALGLGRCFHTESKWLLWNSRLRLIFGLKKALVPAHLDERGLFRGSEAAEVPLITFLPRLFCRPQQKARGGVLGTGRENSWPPGRRSRAARTPCLLPLTH